jgi:hypothetical protein
LSQDDYLQKENIGKLIEAQPGDLILWDSRTIHGGLIGTRESGQAELARLSMCVCMTPKSKASEETLQKRKEAFQSGVNTTHWPHEFHSHF